MFIESVMPSSHLILCRPFSSCPPSFPASGSFPMSQLFTSSDQSIEALASIFPINIQDWFPLGLTGLIFLLSKGHSRVFFSTTFCKDQQEPYSLTKDVLLNTPREKLNQTASSQENFWNLLVVFVCVYSRLFVSNSFVTPWTVAHQAPLSTGFLGKNTGAGDHVLLQGIFPTQGWDLSFLHHLHREVDSLPLVPPGKPLTHF